MKPWSVKTKDWAAGRRWAKRNAIACPGVIYSIRQDGREVSYRYEDGLIYCTGNGKQVKPYRPGFHHLRKKNEFIPISNIGH
jgi:hypothetical protein